MIVISLTIPLGLLVQRQAEQTAQLGAERDAQEVAGLVALATSTGVPTEDLDDVLGDFPTGMAIWLPDGSVIGNPLPMQGVFVDQAATSLAPTSGDLVNGGWEIALPTISSSGIIIVDAAVTPQELNEGVTAAWALLGLLGLLLIGVAVWIGDRMARQLVTPVRELAGVARRLGDGELDARSSVNEPSEFKEVAAAFNYLAGRLSLLLAEEREMAADLSHSLRTPITSLRLRSESLTEENERFEMLAAIDRLEHAVDQLIVASRAPRSDQGSECDLAGAVRERTRFWSVLAEEQDREMTVSIDPGPIEVGLPKESVESAVDILIGNVFDHTPTGTGFMIEVRSRPRPTLIVSDNGPGLPSLDISERGVSGSGSTGLGLDIARRTAERGGGCLRMDENPGGGAVITLEFTGHE
jgi:signal transduction histidine kinase